MRIGVLYIRSWGNTKNSVAASDLVLFESCKYITLIDPLSVSIPISAITTQQTTAITTLTTTGTIITTP